jgi:LacI family transcriptional regulator
MRLVIDHLRDTGCRTFALVSSRAVDSSARSRLAAYQEAVDRDDHASRARVHLGDYSVEWGRAAVEIMLAQGPLPDAVVCGADVIALGVNAALTAAGVQVPTDVAVTGFDDIAFASISTPPLTTLRQPADAIGASGVRLLGSRALEPGRPTVVESLPPELVVRGSSRPPADGP